MKGTTESEEGKGKKGKVKGDDKGHAKGDQIDRSPTLDYGNTGKSDSKGKTKTDGNGETGGKGKTDGKGIGSIQQSPCKVSFGEWEWGSQSWGSSHHQ